MILFGPKLGHFLKDFYTTLYFFLFSLFSLPLWTYKARYTNTLSLDKVQKLTIVKINISQYLFYTIKDCFIEIDKTENENFSQQKQKSSQCSTDFISFRTYWSDTFTAKFPGLIISQP